MSKSLRGQFGVGAEDPGLATGAATGIVCLGQVVRENRAAPSQPAAKLANKR